MSSEFLTHVPGEVEAMMRAKDEALNISRGTVERLQAEVAAARNTLAAKEREIERLKAQFAEHTKAVGKFLSDMYATLIDPLEQETMKVDDMCQVLLHAASDNRQALQDQIDRAGNLPANWKEDSSLETWFPLTAEELKRANSELAALRAAREHDLRPVSDEEWPKTHDGYPRPSITRSVVNRLLARRAAAPSVGYVADGPGPPADWPQCDECGAVMVPEGSAWHCLSCGNSKPRAAAGEKEGEKR